MKIVLSKRTISIVLRIFILAGIIYVLWLRFAPKLPKMHQENIKSTKTSMKLGSGVNQMTEIFNNSNLLQNDTNILDYLRKNHLQFPRRQVRPTVPFGFSHSEWASQLKEIFGDKRNGVFIEAGANDGEFFSNTLTFEHAFNWTGLLVEPNKIIFPELQKGFRKSWIANVCLALKPYPHKVNFIHRVGSQGYYKGNGIIEPNSEFPPPTSDYIRSEYISAGITECFPLFSLLSAINMTKIDFLSLDVQGAELKILKTIPFEYVDIKVILVEYNLAVEGKEAYRDFMISQGYVAYMETLEDFIFIQKRYFNTNTNKSSSELQW